jgi:cell division protein FtsQ
LLRIAALSCLFFGTVAAYCAGAFDRVDDGIARHFYARTAALGFRITDVTLDGREFTSREDVMKALGVREGDPTLAFDPRAARAALETLPRVAEAEVVRRLPGTISVHLTERAPMAIWQKSGKMMLIDHDGVVLGSNDLASYASLPMVVGDGAAQPAASILEAVQHEPMLAKRVTAYIRVGDRRWDLKLDNNVEVKLPENNTESAIHMLAQADTKNGLFERDVAVIDLRLPGKMVIETTQLRDPRRKNPQQQGI